MIIFNYWIKKYILGFIFIKDNIAWFIWIKIFNFQYSERSKEFSLNLYNKLGEL